MVYNNRTNFSGTIRVMLYLAKSQRTLSTKLSNRGLLDVLQSS